MEAEGPPVSEFKLRPNEVHKFAVFQFLHTPVTVESIHLYLEEGLSLAYLSRVVVEEGKEVKETIMAFEANLEDIRSKYLVPVGSKKSPALSNVEQNVDDIMERFREQKELEGKQSASKAT